MVEIFLRLHLLAEIQSREPTVHIIHGIARFDSYRPIIIINGAVQVAFVYPSVSAIVVCPGETWVDPDSLIQVSDCAIQVALSQTDSAAIKVGYGETRFNFDGQIEVSYGAI